jgi:WD40 repeat protein
MEIETEDFLQDYVFDYYGDKMAVCGTDRKIKILEKNEGEDWNQIAIWEAHDAPVWRIQWAHPEYGTILASCGLDKRVNIWQEKKEEGKDVWTCRYKIQDFSDSVEDIAFCPKVYGLKLAAVTLNGKMKIFEPTDYVNNINW